MEMSSLPLSPFHTLCISPVAGQLFQFFVYISLPGSPGLGAKLAGPRQAGQLDHHRDGCLCAPSVPRHSGGQLLLRIVRCESGFRASCGYSSPMGRAPSPQVTSETVDGGSPTFPISLVQTHVSCQCKREDPKSRRTPPGYACVAEPARSRLRHRRPGSEPPIARNGSGGDFDLPGLIR